MWRLRNPLSGGGALVGISGVKTHLHPRIEAKSEPEDLHTPYWLGFPVVAPDSIGAYSRSQIFTHHNM
jgi:hypothetical protein